MKELFDLKTFRLLKPEYPREVIFRSAIATFKVVEHYVNVFNAKKV